MDNNQDELEREVMASEDRPHQSDDNNNDGPDSVPPPSQDEEEKPAEQEEENNLGDNGEEEKEKPSVDQSDEVENASENDQGKESPGEAEKKEEEEEEEEAKEETAAEPEHDDDEVSKENNDEDELSDQPPHLPSEDPSSVENSEKPENASEEKAPEAQLSDEDEKEKPSSESVSESRNEDERLEEQGLQANEVKNDEEDEQEDGEKKEEDTEKDAAQVENKQADEDSEMLDVGENNEQEKESDAPAENPIADNIKETELKDEDRESSTSVAPQTLQQEPMVTEEDKPEEKSERDEEEPSLKTEQDDEHENVTTTTDDKNEDETMADADDGDKTNHDGNSNIHPRDEDHDMIPEDEEEDDTSSIGPIKRFKKRRLSDSITKMPQTHAVILPSYASWFSMDRINSIEQKSIPEFFNKKNKSKTPQTYRRYRDFMINVYRLNPTEYLTVTACRRNLTGDVCAIMRIHGFLEKWGLINYQVEAEARPMGVTPPFTGHWKTTLDTPRGLFPFQFYKGTTDPAALQPPTTTTTNNNESTTNDNDDNNNNNNNNNSNDHNTNPTSETNGTSKEGKNNKPSFDFSNWSKKETLRLLDAVEKTPNDWDSIATHVGGDRTTKDCILRFISLSSEDSYLKNEGSNNLGPLKYDTSHIPFDQADNPVMSTVSFLAGLVDPRVVAAASGKSVEEMRKIEEQREEKENQEKQEDGSDNGETATSTENAAKVALSSIAARSHVLATDTERQMQSQYNSLVSTQLKKIDLKLEKFNKIEKNLEIERRELEREREEIFLSRLALHRKVRTVDNMLGKAIEDAKQGNSDHMKSLLDEAGKIVRDGTKLGVDKTNTNNDSNTADGNEDIKPISVDIPETYKYWSA